MASLLPIRGRLAAYRRSALSRWKRAPLPASGIPPGPAWAAVLWLVIVAACTRSSPEAPPVEAADRAAIVEASGLSAFENPSPLDPRIGTPVKYPGYSVRPVSFQVWPGFRVSAALWRPTGSGPFPGVLLAPGHFGEGKSAGESQEPAHALAARGVAVLVVDPPGVEEWEVPGHQVHFKAGAHNRAILAAAGTSALGLQLHDLRRGLRVLRELVPVEEVAVMGVSGGAVLSFYLLLAEPSLAGGVLVSFVPIPREARAGGCACDTLPGWPGPDPAVLAALERPALWISEVEQPRPRGLPESSRFEVVPGPHSFTAEMRAVAMPWLDRLLEHEVPEAGRAERALTNPPYTEPRALASPGPEGEGTTTIFEIAQAVGGPDRWEPRPRTGVPYTLSCTGEGPVVITWGAGPEDAAALEQAGLRACALDVTVDEVGLAEAIATKKPWADRFAGAVQAAARGRGAVAAWGTGAHAVAVAGSGLPFVLRDPVRKPSEVDVETDPAWVHVPGAWWGGLAPLYADALAVGEDPGELARRLTAHLAAPQDGGEDDGTSGESGRRRGDAEGRE